MADVAGEQLAAIGFLHGRFEAEGVEYWLFGGWAVDFHLGRLTRPHSDIDLAIWQADVERVLAIFDADGWHRPPVEGDGYFVELRGLLRVEIALVERDEAGDVYTPLADGRGVWPQGAFGHDVAVLDRVRARVIGVAALIEDKSAGYGDADAQAKDGADVAMLRNLGSSG